MLRRADGALGRRRPVDRGTISEHPVQAGRPPLVTIGDPAELEIVAELLSSDARAHRGPARGRSWTAGRAAPARAVLTRIEPAARNPRLGAGGSREQRVDVIFDIVTPAVGRRAGASAKRFLGSTCGVVEWEDDSVLQVPLGAVFPGAARGGPSMSWQAGVAEERAVTLGQRGAAHERRCWRGLEAGETDRDASKARRWPMA